MTLTDLCKEVLELDEKATKGPWIIINTSGANQNYWYIDSEFLRETQKLITDCNGILWRHDKEAFCKIASVEEKYYATTAYFEREPKERFIPSAEHWEQFGKPGKFNADLLCHYRTSAPLLAKACLRMKEAIADTQEFYGPPKMSESVGTMGSRLRQIKNILDTASADVDKIVAGDG